MFITADQLLAHMIGDYVIQSDYMANEKTKNSLVCLMHVITYAIPFAFITQSVPALIVIAGTHFLIDRWKIARHVCWFKNLFSPFLWRHPWSECSSTGYHRDRPPWMNVWLLIIVDNCMHVVCNGLAIRFL